MKILLLLFVILQFGCATEVYEDGKLVMRTRSNVKGLSYQSKGGSSFVATDVDNSTPTRAGGTSVAAGSMGVGLGAAMLKVP